MYQEYMISIGDGVSGNAEFHWPFAALRGAGINVVTTASAFHPYQRGKVQNIGIVVAESPAISEMVENAFERMGDLNWTGPRKVRTTVLRDEAGSLVLFMNRLNDDLVDERGYEAYKGFDSLYILKTDDEGIHIGYTLTGDYQGDFVIREG